MALSTPQSRTMAHSPARAADKRNFRSSLLFLLGLFLLGLVVISQLGENGFASWLNLQSKVQELEESTANLERQNQELEARIDAVTNDPATLEKIAREQLDMQRPDEEVLMVLPPAQTPGQGHKNGPGNNLP